MRIIAALLALGVTGWGADPEAMPAGKKMERTACLPCHSLRLIESQRLSKATWTKEVDKMVGWGAVVPDKQALVDYLAAEYGDAKPVPPPEKSVSQ